MKKPRILVVADDAAVRATLARWLMAAGYAVELAESRKRAREVVENTSVALAIVVPERLGAAGDELARELGGEVEQVIVIAERADGSGPASPSLDEQAVLARVASALAAPPIEPRPAVPQLLRFEGYTLDAGGRTCVDANGQEVALKIGRASCRERV
jgi:CheY-like chemotaxis protein